MRCSHLETYDEMQVSVSKPEPYNKHKNSPCYKESRLGKVSVFIRADVEWCCRVDTSPKEFKEYFQWKEEPAKASAIHGLTTRVMRERD